MTNNIAIRISASVVLLGAAAGMAGCKQQPTPAATVPSVAASTPAAAAPRADTSITAPVDAPAAAQPPAHLESSLASISCPSSDFERFANTFSKDRAVQERYTRWPLSERHIDPEAQPEPALVTTQVAQSSAQFPLMPELASARSEGREVRIKKTGASHASVQLVQPDSDNQQTYRFERKSDCWYMTAVEDDSL